MNTTNRIKIICEEACAESVWTKQLFGGLIKELKKRRMAYEQVFEAEDISREDNVCIIGISNAWTEHTVSECNAAGCVPLVLSCQSQRTAQGQYHLICADTKNAARRLKEAILSAGRSKIALYGANFSADLDKDRTSIFSQMISEPSDIYANTGNLETCFRSFFPKAALYDAVICVNGYAAISLVKKLEKEKPELLDHLAIVSCEEVLRYSKYNEWISLIDLNLESYGGAAMAVLDMAALRSDISVITIRMNAAVQELPVKDLQNSRLLAEETAYYEDPEIVLMEKIEQLLRDADDMDHHIIAMLMDNAKYSDIADSCYMTEGNVKYRVKKYMTVSGCSTKRELIELLQEYLQ